MLIEIRHPERGEIHPDRLAFSFSECGFRKRIDYMNRRIQKSPRGAPADAETPDESHFQRIPRGSRGFAELSPRTGDAFRFWVPLASRSDVSIVISPLGSLVRDARTPFKVVGGSGFVDQINYTRIRLGRLRLIYIDPESVANRGFLDELRKLVHGIRLHCLIIDNAHSISEWSTDFRPSYRRLPAVIDALRKETPRMTALAFTAVSDGYAIADIPDLFGDKRPGAKAPALENLTPVPADKDNPLFRKNLSFQMAATHSPAEKAAAYQRILTEEVPALFSRQGFPADAPEGIPPMKEPYASALSGGSTNGMSDNSPADIVSVTTTARGPASETPLVLIFASLAGSMTSWLYKSVRAARRERRIHCVRLADLPNEACEADMAARFSRIPACRDRLCPFDRDALCDYGKQHHLIQAELTDPATGTLQALQVLDYLFSSYEAGDNPVQVDITSLDRTEVELALHRLRAIGVVEDYFMDQSHGHPVFKAYGFINGIEPTAAGKGVVAFLKRHDISSNRRFAGMTIRKLKTPFGEIDRCKERYGEAIRAGLETAGEAGKLLNYEKYKVVFYQAAEYLPVILDLIHLGQCAMRYRKAWNLKEFFAGQVCRYARMIQTVRAIDEQWRCGWCDRCAPDLVFSQGERTPPDILPHLEARISEWLANPDAPFDVAEADDFTHTESRYYYNAEVRPRRLLETMPANIKALYIAREFARDHLKDRCELELIRTAHRDLAWEQVTAIFESSAPGKAVRMARFEALDDEFGPFHCAEGEAWLREQAVKTGVDETSVRLLEGRMALNALKAVDFEPVLEKLTKLNQRMKESEGGTAVES